MARTIALVYNWWSLFTGLAIPEKHAEAITSRPLLLNAVGKQTTHSGQTTVTVTSMHAKAPQDALGAAGNQLVPGEYSQCCGAVDLSSKMAPHLEPGLLCFSQGQDTQTADRECVVPGTRAEA